MSVTLGFKRFVFGMALGLPALLLTSGAIAADRAAKPKAAKPAKASDAATVEMFDAMKSGDIAVKLIPKDSTESRVIITNNTDKPLNVKLPAAFAGVPVPVLAQFGGAGGGMGGMGGGRNNQNGNGGGNNNNQQNQGTGGGMGGGMMGGGGMGGGGMGGGGMGMFNVPADKTAQFKVVTVCLDHGLAEPRPQVPYEIRPIESYSEKPGVAELCILIGNGGIDQRAAQAAAWHLNNGMSWDDLAKKTIHRLGGASYPYFSRAELQRGYAVSEKALELAKNKPAKESSATSLSKSASTN